MGLGYIGLPTAIIAAKHGIDIIGVDVNDSVVEMTNSGRLHIVEPGLEEMLKEVVASGKLKAYSTPQEADAFFIVVPTPFKGNHEPDISYVESATRMVLPYLRPGNIFVIESTSPVGTTEKMANLIFTQRPELKGTISVAYCPERVLPGNIIYELTHNDRVIGGIDERSTEQAKTFYSRFVSGNLYATNCKTAEMCKLTENASRDVQIAFANELSLICDKAGINVWELIKLANRHPRVNILQPGCGVGGHCIAVDPYFITSAFPAESKLISRARDVNNNKPVWCVEKVRRAIFDFQFTHRREPRVALMGLAFEALVVNNYRELIRPLRLEGQLITSAASYRRKTTHGKNGRKGVQIDFLIQTRKALCIVEIKRRESIDRDIIREVDERVRAIRRRDGVSVRTVLVYEGELSPVVAADGYFDTLVPFRKLLGLS